MRRIWIAAAIVALGSFALLGAACGDDDGDDGSAPPSTPTTGVRDTPTAPASPQPDPTATPSTGNGTGDDVLDEVIAAIGAQDLERIEELLVFQQVACEPPSQGAGGPPQCQEGEAPGTLVSVIQLAQCEGFYARQSEVILDALAEGTMALYGAYRPPAQYFPEGDYAVIFEHEPSASGGSALEVVVSDDGITGINFGCGESPEQLVEARGLTDRVDTMP